MNANRRKKRNTSNAEESGKKPDKMCNINKTTVEYADGGWRKP